MNAHPVDVYVGKRLRMRRTMLGMSQEALGKSIGVTFQQIQKYERGVNRMGSSRLYDFSIALGVEVAYFFADYESEAAANTNPARGMSDSVAPDFQHEQLTTREMLELMRAYSTIPSQKLKKQVADMIKTMSREPA